MRWWLLLVSIVLLLWLGSLLWNQVFLGHQ
jgi:hypothetical protein